MPKPYQPYWLEESLIIGTETFGASGEIAVIGSGLAGVSSAYWLQQMGFRDITLLDYRPEEAASFRNCGHILHGTVESPKALVALHDFESAKKIWEFSVSLCDQVKSTVSTLQIDTDYRQDGYLVIAIDDAELNEIHDSIQIIEKFGFNNQFWSQKTLEEKGFQNVKGARYEAESAQAHPVKFRNGVLKSALKQGLKYIQPTEIKSLNEVNGSIEVSSTDATAKYDAVVIAANAYSPLFSDYFRNHHLVEPFRGQK